MKHMILCGPDILIWNNMKNIKQNKKVMLSASLVCADMMNIQGEIFKLEKGGIDYIHFDVMDNQFVPRFGLHPEILQSLKKKTKIPIDVHLMVNNPENAIPAFIQAGADIIVFHIESTLHAHRLIRQIKSAGIKAGIAINPATNLDVLDYLLEDIDMVMLMAINPGILGHKLIPEMMKKISDLKTKLKNHKNIMIAIDGGVSFDSAQEMVKRGASFLVCGTSTIFKPEGDVDVKIVELNKLLTKVNKK